MAVIHARISLEGYREARRRDHMQAVYSAETGQIRYVHLQPDSFLSDGAGVEVYGIHRERQKVVINGLDAYILTWGA